MLNDYLSSKEAEVRIKERIQDAETDNLLRRLGYKDHVINRWVVALVILVVMAGLLL